MLKAFSYILKLAVEHYFVTLLILIPGIVFIVYTGTKRYTHYSQFPSGCFSFKAFVTKVGDGDGCKAVHIPFLLSNDVRGVCPLNIRLAGIDAPEVRLFSKPAQAFSKEAKLCLQKLILDKMISVRAIKLDNYNRLLCIIYVKAGLFKWINVNLEMVRLGLACVYVNKDAVYDGMEDELKALEKKAKDKRVGMWVDENPILPKDHKNMYRSPGPIVL